MSAGGAGDVRSPPTPPSSCGVQGNQKRADVPAAASARYCLAMPETIDLHDDEQQRHFQKIDTIGRLAAGIAHDFNNILTAIVGYTDLLSHEAGSSVAREDLAEIRRAAERAAGLTRQILAFTRQEAPASHVVDVNRIVIDLSRMLRRLIDESIDLGVDCGAARATVRADAGQLEQVVINLVVNARDAMARRISIATRRVAADAAFTAAHPDVAPGDYVALEVIDNGQGMTDNVRARLFDPFFTTKAAGRGTGLGLSVVSGIVRDSGGHLLVDSTPGRGSRFTVLLPLADGSADSISRASIDRRRVDGCATILIAEDDEQVRSLASAWLRRYGYTVFEAANGEEALALAAGGGVRPDLLVTDVVMPDLSGAPLADSLRAMFRRLKVLYMSGHANRPEIQSRLKEDGVAFLQKPFSPGRLLSEVRTLLTWAAAERRTLSSFGELPPAPARKATPGVASSPSALRMG